MSVELPTKSFKAVFDSTEECEKLVKWYNHQVLQEIPDDDLTKTFLYGTKHGHHECKPLAKNTKKLIQMSVLIKEANTHQRDMFLEKQYRIPEDPVEKQIAVRFFVLCIVRIEKQLQTHFLNHCDDEKEYSELKNYFGGMHQRYLDAMFGRFTTTETASESGTIEGDTGDAQHTNKRGMEASGDKQRKKRKRCKNPLKIPPRNNPAVQTKPSTESEIIRPRKSVLFYVVSEQIEIGIK